MGRRKSTSKTKPKGLALIAIGLAAAFAAGRGSSSKDDGKKPQAHSEQSSQYDEPVTPPSSGSKQTEVAASPPAVAEVPARPMKLKAKDGTVIEDPKRWRPKSVKLTAPAEVIVIENGKFKERKTLPVGTEVILTAISREMMYFDFKGSTGKVPAVTTDLADQMSMVELTPE